ncbi:MAG: NusG domain II-containing protein [Spirochaetales bacterium]|nr:NusG domain II-containing protein [Spirochaetales bacterium]
MIKADLKIFDYIIIALSAAAIIFLSVRIYTAEPGAPVLKVDTADYVYIYPLEEDMEVEVEGPIGSSHIIIKDGTAYISSSPCEDQLCVLMGGISEPGQWAACLPNRVFLSIEGGEDDEEIDILSY